MKISKVFVDATFVRLLFTHMFINLFELRESIKDLCNDNVKKILCKYQINIIRDLDTLRSLILPGDSNLGSLNLDDTNAEE